MFNFLELNENYIKGLKFLTEKTGGTYKFIDNLRDLKYRMQLLGANAFTSIRCYIKMKGEKGGNLPDSANLYFE